MKMKLLIALMTAMNSYSAFSAIDAKDCPSLTQTTNKEDMKFCKAVTDKLMNTPNEKRNDVIAYMNTHRDEILSSNGSGGTLGSGGSPGNITTCKTIITNMKNVLEALTKNKEQEDDSSAGSKSLRECVKLTKGNFRYLYKGGSPAGQPSDWMIYVNNSDACLAKINCEEGTFGDIAAIQANEKYKACTKSTAETLARCDAAAFLISTANKDWSSETDTSNKSVEGGNPKMTCKRMGIETLDFDGCAKFVQNGDIMDVAQGAIQKGQELYYQDKTMTAQADAAKSDNTATASLEALKSSVKSQQDIMTQRAALDTGKLAVLATYYSEIPTHEDLKAKCSSFSYRTPATLIVGLNQAGSSVQVSDQAACPEVAAKPSFALLMNQQEKEKMKAKLVKVGIDVGSDAVMAGLMAKRAGDLNDAIAKVDAFKPIDPLAPAADNLQTTYCQQNPGDTKCLTGGLDRTFDAMGDNVISFGEGGTGTSYNNSNPFIDTNGTTTNAVGPTDRKSVASVGSVVSAAQQNGGLATTAAAATVTKGGAPAAGGGGGGSGGGGVGGGGGGGAPAGAQGATSGAIAGRAPTYGGGSGTLSMMGGNGINRSKSTAKDDGNPFGKLFGKGGNASGAINFGGRAPASVGTKGDNLFDMISKRYSNVSSDKRLLEYELTK